MQAEGEQTQYKTCNLCKRILGVESFYKDRTSYRPRCRACVLGHEPRVAALKRGIKKCARCKLEKLISEFSIGKGKCKKIKSYCKSCTRVRSSEKRIKDIEKIKKIKDIVNNIKSQPCTDCNVSYPPYVMDFDHRDPNTKQRNISRMVNSIRKIEKILEEIAKCDVVCANCHRIRTNKQQILRNKRWL